MGAQHLEQQAARRHEEYQKAEIASLREQVRQAEDRITAILTRLDTIERNLGWPGN